MSLRRGPDEHESLDPEPVLPDVLVDWAARFRVELMAAAERHAAGVTAER